MGSKVWPSGTLFLYLREMGPGKRSHTNTETAFLTPSYDGIGLGTSPILAWR